MARFLIENDERIALFAYMYEFYRFKFFDKMNKVEILIYNIFGICLKKHKRSNYGMCKLVCRWYKLKHWDDEEAKKVIKLDLYHYWKDKITKFDNSKDIFKQYHFNNDFERMIVCRDILQDLIHHEMVKILKKEEDYRIIDMEGGYYKII
jgi:hypothetical protein